MPRAGALIGFSARTARPCATLRAHRSLRRIARRRRASITPPMLSAGAQSLIAARYNEHFGAGSAGWRWGDEGSEASAAMQLDEQDCNSNGSFPAFRLNAGRLTHGLPAATDNYFLILPTPGRHQDDDLGLAPSRPARHPGRLGRVRWWNSATNQPPYATWMVQPRGSASVSATGRHIGPITDNAARPPRCHPMRAMWRLVVINLATAIGIALGLASG